MDAVTIDRTFRRSKVGLKPVETHKPSFTPPPISYRGCESKWPVESGDEPGRKSWSRNSSPVAGGSNGCR
jgi:hypothetical protein